MSVKTSQLTISQRRKKKEKLQKSSVFVNSQREETGLHLSIIKCGEDILESIKLTPCTGCELGCENPCRKKKTADRYHCPLCITSIFKPAVHCKTKKHLLNHFQGIGAIVLRGYKITGCHLKCVTYSQKNQQRSHFHCPFCSDTFANKSFLIKHGRHCGLQGKQNLFKIEKINDAEKIDSNKMTQVLTNAETAHSLSKMSEKMESTNLALKRKSETSSTPKKHFKFKKLLHSNFNVTISATSKNSSDLNEKERVYPPVECTQCRQLYHPKYIYQHIRMQHETVKSKPNISQSRHHHSVCIDSRLSLYTSAKTISGIQIPLHVIKILNNFDNNPSLITIEDLKKRFKCESKMCMNKCRSEWVSGNIDYLCDHLKSVDFSVEPGNRSLDENLQWLDKEWLGKEQLPHGQLSENRYKMISYLNSKAINKNTPMVIELPQAFKSYHKTKRSRRRFTFYSVYTGYVSKWSKFERTVVTIDHLKNAIHCQCHENACVHRGAVICWLYQNEKIKKQLFEIKYREKNENVRKINKFRIPRKENELSIRIARDNTKVEIKASKKPHKELSLKTIYVVDKDSKNIGIPCISDFVSKDKNLKIAGNTLLNCDLDKSILNENVDHPIASNSSLKYSSSKEDFTNKPNLSKYSDRNQENQILPIVSNNFHQNKDFITSDSPINIVTNKVRKVFKVINIVKDKDSLFRAAGENLEDYTQEDYLELKDLVSQWLADCDHTIYKIPPQSINIPSQSPLKQETLSNLESEGQISNILQASSTSLIPISVRPTNNHTIGPSQDTSILQEPSETKERLLNNLIEEAIRQKVITSHFVQKNSNQSDNKELASSNLLSSYQLSSHNEKQYMIALSNIFSVTIKVYINSGGHDDHIDTYTPIEGISEEILHFKRDKSRHYDALTQTDVPDELYTVV